MTSELASFFLDTCKKDCKQVAVSNVGEFLFIYLFVFGVDLVMRAHKMQAFILIL